MSLIKDSRGQKSWTVTLTVPAILILMTKFILSGIAIGPFVLASVDPISFATAFAAILAPLVARDAADKFIVQAQQAPAEAIGFKVEAVND
jgi:hypothetical protein